MYTAFWESPQTTLPPNPIKLFIALLSETIEHLAKTFFDGDMMITNTSAKGIGHIIGKKRT